MMLSGGEVLSRHAVPLPHQELLPPRWLDRGAPSGAPSPYGPGLSHGGPAESSRARFRARQFTLISRPRIWRRQCAAAQLYCERTDMNVVRSPGPATPWLRCRLSGAMLGITPPCRMVRSPRRFAWTHWHVCSTSSITPAAFAPRQREQSPPIDRAMGTASDNSS